MCIEVHIINKYVFLKDKDFFNHPKYCIDDSLFHDNFFLHKFPQVSFLSFVCLGL